jgi:DNA-binding response OmpR family regulator
MMKFLDIDRNVQCVDTHAAIWAERNIGVHRVNTMTEGVKLLRSNNCMFVAINADTVDFMPLLRALRGMTNAPILIGTDNFTTKKEIAALERGADLYARFHEAPEDNVSSVMAHVERITKRNREKIPPLQIITCGNMIVVVDNKMVFCKDTETFFTPKEYSVLNICSKIAT